MRRFEFVEGKSNKFWEIEQNTKQLNIRWGRVGTQGQSQTKDFSDEASAKTAMDKLIKEKTDKGYAEIKVDANNRTASVPTGSAATSAVEKAGETESSSESVLQQMIGGLKAMMGKLGADKKTEDKKADVPALQKQAVVDKDNVPVEAQKSRKQPKMDTAPERKRKWRLLPSNRMTNRPIAVFSGCCSRLPMMLLIKIRLSFP